MPIVKTYGGELITYDVKPINKGGNEGAVHKVTHPLHLTDHCIKLYHSKKNEKDWEEKIKYREKKTRYMVQNRPNLEHQNFRICWPVEMIFERLDYNFMGFMMMQAFTGSVNLTDLTLPGHPEKGMIWQKFDRNTLEGSRKRLQLCVNLASAIHKIHSTKKYVFVDYKPENVLISSDGKVSIIDVDSFQIAEKSNVLFNAKALTPQYKPPESKALNPAIHYIPESWDRFSIAVSFYQILFGLHPYAGTAGGPYENVSDMDDKIENGLFVHGAKRKHVAKIPDLHDGFYNLSPVLQNLFIKSFEEGNRIPDLRASAETWGQSIYEQLTRNTALVGPLAKRQPANHNIPNNPAKVNAHLSSQQTPIKQSSFQPVNPAPTRGAKIVNINNPTTAQVKPQQPKKKPNYMFWKVANVILIMVIVGFYINYTDLQRKLSETTTELYEMRNVNLELRNVQNTAENLEEKLKQSNKRSLHTGEILNSIRKKYPITIKGITFQNVNSEGINLSPDNETTSFLQSELECIAPVITFESNLDQDTSLTIFYEILGPDFKPLTSGEELKVRCDMDISNVPKKQIQMKLPQHNISEYSKGEVPVGQYKINIWCNNAPIFQGEFQVI